MARPLRIEFPNALYHITSRGNRSENIYLDDNDRSNFLDILSQVRDRFNWIFYRFCQMLNHYHLLVEVPEANLSQGMRQLNGVYTQNSTWPIAATATCFRGSIRLFHMALGCTIRR